MDQIHFLFFRQTDNTRHMEYCASGCDKDIERSLDLGTKNQTLCGKKAEGLGEVFGAVLGGIVMGAGRMMALSCDKNAEGKVCDSNETQALFSKVDAATKDVAKDDRLPRIKATARTSRNWVPATGAWFTR